MEIHFANKAKRDKINMSFFRLSICLVICCILVSCSTTSNQRLSAPSESKANTNKSYSRDQISQVQALLKDKGYSPGPVDGILGKKTERAISRFKIDTGFLPIHPLVSKKLIAKLESYEPRKSTSPAKKIPAKPNTQKPKDPVVTQNKNEEAQPEKEVTTQEVTTQNVNIVVGNTASPEVKVNEVLPGYELVSQVYGHAIYTPKNTVNQNNCSGNFPLRVQLRSLLPLQFFDHEYYPRSFFFYAESSLRYVCSRTGTTPRSFAVTYFFRGKQVATNRIVIGEKVDHRVPPWSVQAAQITTSPSAFPESHPNYYEDQVFLQMLTRGRSIAEYGYEPPSIETLERRAKRGDVQAAYFVASNPKAEARGKFWTEGLFREVMETRDVYTQQMEAASDSGSVSASINMALAIQSKYRFANENKPFQSIPKDQQRLFKFYLARAIVGGAFGVREEFGYALNQWNIDLNSEIEFVEKNGLRASLTGLLDLANSNSEISDGEIRISMGEYLVSQKCSKLNMFLEGNGSNALPLIFNQIKTRGKLCIERQELKGSYWWELKIGIDRAEKIKCESQSNYAKCAVLYNFSCDIDANNKENEIAARLSFGPICLAAKKDYVTNNAMFVREGHKWRMTQWD